jgi:hypothetical protein
LRVWMFSSCESLPLKSRSFLRRKGSRELCRCLLGYFGSFLSEQGVLREEQSEYSIDHDYDHQQEHD